MQISESCRHTGLDSKWKSFPLVLYSCKSAQPSCRAGGEVRGQMLRDRPRGTDKAAQKMGTRQCSCFCFRRKKQLTQKKRRATSRGEGEARVHGPFRSSAPMNLSALTELTWEGFHELQGLYT